MFFFSLSPLWKDQLPRKNNHAFKHLGNASKPVRPKPEAIPSLTSHSYSCPSMSTSAVISGRDLDHGYHMLQKRAFLMAVSLSHDIPLKLRLNHIKMVRIQMRIFIYTKENLLARYDKNQMWPFFFLSTQLEFPLAYMTEKIWPDNGYGEDLHCWSCQEDYTPSILFRACSRHFSCERQARKE